MSIHEVSQSIDCLAGVCESILVELRRIADVLVEIRHPRLMNNHISSEFIHGFGSRRAPVFGTPPSNNSVQIETECNHPRRRTTGFRIECMDCGRVIEDQGGAQVLEQHARDEIHRNQQLNHDNERLQQRVRDLEKKIVYLNKRVVRAEDHVKALGGKVVRPDVDDVDELIGEYEVEIKDPVKSGIGHIKSLGDHDEHAD